jgi:hypothetical protein
VYGISYFHKLVPFPAGFFVRHFIVAKRKKRAKKNEVQSAFQKWKPRKKLKMTEKTKEREK